MMIARVLSAIAVIGMQCLLLSSDQWESVLQVSKDLLGSVPAQPMEWGDGVEEGRGGYSRYATLSSR